MQRSHKSVKNSQLGLIICFVSIISLWQLQVEGQFFTKTTNSIPRMGRRASPSAYQNVRHLLIDRLVDEYGPNLLEAYKTGRLSSDEARGYQPSEWPVDPYSSPGQDNPGGRYM